VYGYQNAGHIHNIDW